MKRRVSASERLARDQSVSSVIGVMKTGKPQNDVAPIMKTLRKPM